MNYVSYVVFKALLLWWMCWKNLLHLDLGNCEEWNQISIVQIGTQGSYAVVGKRSWFWWRLCLEPNCIFFLAKSLFVSIFLPNKCYLSKLDVSFFDVIWPLNSLISYCRTCGRSFPHQSRLRQVTHLCFLMLSFKNRHLIFCLGSLI